MPPKQYVPGDTVFAKLKGYPWWPARVEDDNDIPAKILKQKTKTKSPLYTVFFYGSRDYGFFGSDCIRPFDRDAVERDLKAKKFKTKDLEHAIHQALDPSLLKAEEEAEKAEREAEEEEEEGEGEEEEEEEEEEEVKPKKKGRKRPAVTEKKKAATTAASTATAATKKRANQKKTVDDTKSKNNTSKAKRARSEEISEADRKKRRKSLSTEQEDNASLRDSPSISRKSEEPQHTNSNHNNSNSGNQSGSDKAALDLEAFKKRPEYKKVYHSRHRLQKLIYEKKPGEIAKEDYTRIAQVLKEIEDTEMTFDLLRYTKIGKVVKYGCGYSFENDEHDIQTRCLQLMKKWKSVLLGSDRQAAEQQQDNTSQTSNGNHA